MMAILERSAPSEVNAPPIADTLADINECSVCENFAASIWLIFAGLISSPPEMIDWALTPRVESAINIAILKILFIFLSLFFCVTI